MAVVLYSANRSRQHGRSLFPESHRVLTPTTRLNRGVSEQLIVDDLMNLKGLPRTFTYIIRLMNAPLQPYQHRSVISGTCIAKLPEQFGVKCKGIVRVLK